MQASYQVSKEIKNLAPLYPSKYAAKLSPSEITEEDTFFCTPSRLPSNLDYKATQQLFSMVEDPKILYYKKLLEAQGWAFYAITQSRGTCYYLQRRITIPVWSIQKGTDYLNWYISHEIAHAFAGHTAKHGEYFMAWLKAICPAASIHFETNYKPRNASISGISSSKEENLLRDAVANLTDADFL